MYLRLVLLGVLITGAISCRDRTASGSGEADGGVVARVNGFAISLQEFRSTLQHAEKSFSKEHGQLGEEEEETLTERILEKMIGDELLLQHAHAEGVRVTEAEVNKRFEALKRSGGGEAAFSDFLAETGLEPERVRANLARNMVLERLTARIRDDIQVSQDEISKTYQDHRDDFRSAETVELAHILFKGQDGAERALRVLRKIRAGLPFEEAVRKFSQDPATRDRGGRLGILKKGEMLPDLEAAAFGLEEGAISSPVKSPAGIHLLKVITKHAASVRPLSQVASEVREMTVDSRVEQTIQRLTERLRKQAKIEILHPPRPD